MDEQIDLPTQKREIYVHGDPRSTTISSMGYMHLQVIPDSQYFTELEQILACLQLNWDNQEYMITALKNSIKMGYKLVKP